VIVEFAGKFVIPALEKSPFRGLAAVFRRRDHDNPMKEAPPWILAPATLNPASPAGAKPQAGFTLPPPSTR
jgi:hypothetical protein